MKFFDTDLKSVFRWLAVWEQLSLEARRHYLLAVPAHAQSVSAAGYGSELSGMIEAGLVEATASSRIKPSLASVPFRAVMALLACEWCYFRHTNPHKSSIARPTFVGLARHIPLSPCARSQFHARHSLCVFLRIRLCKSGTS
jgi:hypothetical protein